MKLPTKPRIPSSSPEDDADADRPPAERSKRRGIQSIEIGFTILEALRTANGPIPLKKIAAICQMPVANVHNYLVSFQKVGIVVQEQDTGFYGLGQYALQLGMAALQQFDIHKVARPLMAELGARTGYSVFLGVWGNKGPTIVYRVECAQSPPLMELRVGSVLPLLTSALGRNFLSHLPQQVTAGLVRDELNFHRKHPQRHPGDVPRSLADIEAMTARVRENGFSSCKGSFLPGFTTMSAPVFDPLGGMIAGITVMGSSDAVSDEVGSEPVQLLRQSAAQISSAAGWRG